MRRAGQEQGLGVDLNATPGSICRRDLNGGDGPFSHTCWSGRPFGQRSGGQKQQGPHSCQQSQDLYTHSPMHSTFEHLLCTQHTIPVAILVPPSLIPRLPPLPSGPPSASSGLQDWLCHPSAKPVHPTSKSAPTYPPPTAHMSSSATAHYLPNAPPSVHSSSCSPFPSSLFTRRRGAALAPLQPTRTVVLSVDVNSPSQKSPFPPLPTTHTTAASTAPASASHTLPHAHARGRVLRRLRSARSVRKLGGGARSPRSTEQVRAPPPPLPADPFAVAERRQSSLPPSTLVASPPPLSPVSRVVDKALPPLPHRKAAAHILKNHRRPPEPPNIDQPFNLVAALLGEPSYPVKGAARTSSPAAARPTSAFTRPPHELAPPGPMDVRDIISKCEDASMSWSLQFWVTIADPQVSVV